MVIKGSMETVEPRKKWLGKWTIANLRTDYSVQTKDIKISRNTTY